MQNIVKYALGAVVALILGWLSYRDVKGRAETKQKLDQIEQERKALFDTVTNIRLRTNERDEKLRDAIGRNMDILDSLNKSLNRLNKNSAIIDNHIKNTQKDIDALWKNN